LISWIPKNIKVRKNARLKRIAKIQAMFWVKSTINPKIMEGHNAKKYKVSSLTVHLILKEAPSLSITNFPSL
jgi:hypothetical protein